MRTISLHKASNFDISFYQDYSKFKHGSKTSARKFGKQVAEIADFEPNSSLIFYPAPANNIVTASHAFNDYFLSFCATQFLEKNIKIKRSSIRRKYSFTEDYGKMDAEQRQTLIQKDRYAMNTCLINPDDTLVFVDDIRITGSHEKNIVRILEEEKIQNNVIFLYLAIYDGDNPIIEHDLNHYSVKNLKDVNNIIRNEEFIFNTRVVKFILNADIEEFVSFITYQSETFIETLFSLSVLNEYHLIDKYKTNFNILKNLQ